MKTKNVRKQKKSLINEIVQIHTKVDIDKKKHTHRQTHTHIKQTIHMHSSYYYTNITIHVLFGEAYYICK